MQKLSLLLFFTLVLGVSVVQFSCSKDETCTTENMSFKTDIQPILSKNGCTDSGCHGSTTGTGAIAYTTYDGFFSQVAANRVLGAIKQQTGFSAMPKGKSKISDCDISKIEAWITQGAKDN